MVIIFINIVKNNNTNNNNNNIINSRFDENNNSFGNIKFDGNKKQRVQGNAAQGWKKIPNFPQTRSDYLSI